MFLTSRVYIYIVIDVTICQPPTQHHHPMTGHWSSRKRRQFKPNTCHCHDALVAWDRLGVCSLCEGANAPAPPTRGNHGRRAEESASGGESVTATGFLPLGSFGSPCDGRPRSSGSFLVAYGDGARRCSTGRSRNICSTHFLGSFQLGSSHRIS